MDGSTFLYCVKQCCRAVAQTKQQTKMRKKLLTLSLLFIAGLIPTKAQQVIMVDYPLSSGQNLYCVMEVPSSFIDSYPWSNANDIFSRVSSYSVRGDTNLSGNVTIPTALVFYADSSYTFTFLGPYVTGTWTTAPDTTWTFNITTIADNAFSGCTGITSITFPNTVTTIGNNAFSGCTGLTSITIPSPITYVGTSAFANCTGLTTVNYNADSCVSFGYYGRVFRGCTNITTVNIGQNVRYIPGKAFQGCSGLTTVNFNADSCRYAGSNGTSFTYGNEIFKDCPNFTTLNIGANVKFIPDWCFYGCDGLSTVTIPSCVTQIGWGAFSNCQGLTTVNFNADSCNKNQGYYAFEGDSSLTTLNIGSNVKVIPHQMFQRTGLTSVTIPPSVEHLGKEAFADCWNLTTVNFNADSCLSRITYGDGSYSEGGFFARDSNLVTLNIGNNVKCICGSAFCVCPGLESVVIPSSVKYIGRSAFGSCSGLSSITISSSVDSIGQNAFSGCTNLMETRYTGTISDWCKIRFGNRDANPIYYSHNLYINNVPITNLVIPDGVTSIGAYAFYGFSSMTSLSISNTVTSIGEGAFCSCSGMASVALSNSLAEIGYYVFTGCSSLGSVMIPNSVSSIRSYAFSECSGLCSLSLGIGITEIEYGAFSGCTGLAEITSYSNVAPTLGYGAFYDVTSTIPVNIPCGSAPSYLSRWNYFSNFVEMAEASFSAITSDSTMGTVTVLTQPTCTSPTAVIYASANTGYRFDHWSDGDESNPRTLTVSIDTVIVGYFVPDGVGIDDAVRSAVTVAAQGLDVVVGGATGQRIRIFDVMGRLVAARNEATEEQHFHLATAGVYLVQVGDGAAQRVVVW